PTTSPSSASCGMAIGYGDRSRTGASPPATSCSCARRPRIWSAFAKTATSSSTRSRSTAPPTARPKSGSPPERDVEEQLVQAVVAPDSDLIGRTIGDVDFRRRYDAIVLGLWRQRGFIEQELAEIRLRAGDVLVLQGDDEALERVGNDGGFLM